jgi:hypothetical protein
MRTLAEFTKTTMIGGILVILPIYVAVGRCAVGDLIGSLLLTG